MNNLSNYAARMSILLLSAVLLTGCVTAKFTEPITSFRDSINTSGAAIGTYYAELNQFEREIYLDQRLYDPAKEVLATDKEGKPTSLIGARFSAESIKARTDAIALLGVYVQQLGKLASSDAPKEFLEGSKMLGDNLFNLQNTFEKLGADDTGRKAIDANAKNYSGPVGTIVGVIGRVYLEKHRDAAINTIVEEGAPAVRKLLSLLQKDLTEVIDPLKRTGLKEKLADRVTYYNDNRNVNFEQRKQMLAGINAAASSYEVVVTANPSNLIETMSEAHESLVKYAKSPKAPETLAELNAALETFKNNAKEVSDAVIQIRSLRKGA